MGVYSASWNAPVLVEAHKFWFYALSLSLLGAVCTLAVTAGSQASQRQQAGKAGTRQTESRQTESEKPSEDGRKRPPATEAVVSSTALKKSIVVDACDLFIPGSFLGWIPADDATAGMAIVVSTLVAMQDIWTESLNK